ncbi:MAG: extracellular solute-binding protein [Acidilobus sp.]
MRSLSAWALAAIVIVIIVVTAVGVTIYYMRYRPKPVTLTIVTYTGAPSKFLALAAEEFESRHPNVVVQVINFSFSQYVSNELTVLKSGSSQYDIVTFTPTSSMVLEPYLVPLNSSVLNLSDLIWPVESFGGVYRLPNGSTQVIGVAFETDGMVLMYDAALFDNATLEQEFYDEYHMQLSPWTWHNWTAVVDASKFFVSHNITKYGILVYTDPTHDIIDAFPLVFEWYYMHEPALNCGNLGGLPDYGTMFMGCVPSGWPYGFPPPSYNSSAGVQALEAYAQLVGYEPNPKVLTISYDNIVQLITSGQAPGGFVFISQFSSIPPSVRSQYLMAPAPGDYAEAGSTFFGISRYSQHKALALEFLRLVLSPSFQEQAFLRLSIYPISKAAFQALLSNSSLPTYEHEWLEEAYSAALHAYAAPPAIVGTATFLVPAFNQEVFSYLTGAITSPQQALQAAASKWVQELSAISG